MSRRRALLLGVAGLLSVSALLAIAILLVGRFGGVQGRILGTTALLAGYGILALPAVILLDQERLRPLADATRGCAALGACLALAAVWTPDVPVALGRAIIAVTLAAAACAQTAALAARRREQDPLTVRRLFAASCGTAGLAAVLGAVLIYAQPHGSLYPRLYGALVVLDLLLVALQPVLARARPTASRYGLAVRTADGSRVQLAIDATDLASAAAKAIRIAERDGRTVSAVEVEELSEPRG